MQIPGDVMKILNPYLSVLVIISLNKPLFLLEIHNKFHNITYLNLQQLQYNNDSKENPISNILRLFTCKY